MLLENLTSIVKISFVLRESYLYSSFRSGSKDRHVLERPRQDPPPDLPKPNGLVFLQMAAELGIESDLLCCSKPWWEPIDFLMCEADHQS